MSKLLKIQLEIKGQKISLTLDECKELRGELNKIVPVTEYVPYFKTPWFEAPLNQPYYSTVTISDSTNTN